jgi:hypothetical protein
VEIGRPAGIAYHVATRPFLAGHQAPWIVDQETMSPRTKTPDNASTDRTSSAAVSITTARRDASQTRQREPGGSIGSS